MARFKTETGSNTVFKPQARVEYRPTVGQFRVYDTEKKESVDVDSVTFAAAANFQRYEGEDFTSSIVANLFKDNIKIFETTPFKYVKTAVYDKDKKIEGYEDGSTTLCVVGVLNDGRTAEIKLKGVTKIRLVKKEQDGSNAEDVKTFADAEFMTLSPSKNEITVGTGKKTKKILPLTVKDEGKVPEELEDALTVAYESAMAEVKANNESQESEKQEAPTDAPRTQRPKDGEEIHIEDIPF